MRRNSTSISRALALAFAFILSVTAVAADADGKKLQAITLGKHTVGSPLSEVRGYKAGDDCVIEREKADCAFVDPDGVEYVVLDDSVTLVTANEKSTSRTLRLPFGLRFGDSVGAAIQKLIVGDRVWLVGSDHSGGVTLSSYDRYAGVRNWDFKIEIRFEEGRLVEIKYNAGSV
jgi:hypothetical protein